MVGVRWVKGDLHVVEPARHLVGVEADEVTPFQVGDASFGDQSAHVPDGHAEVLGKLVDTDECR